MQAHRQCPMLAPRHEPRSERVRQQENRRTWNSHASACASTAIQTNRLRCRGHAEKKKLRASDEIENESAHAANAASWKRVHDGTAEEAATAAPPAV